MNERKWQWTLFVSVGILAWMALWDEKLALAVLLALCGLALVAGGGRDSLNLRWIANAGPRIGLKGEVPRLADFEGEEPAGLTCEELRLHLVRTLQDRGGESTTRAGGQQRDPRISHHRTSRGIN